MKKESRINMRNYDQFLSRMKSKFKKQKQQRKQFLRQIAIQKLVQSSQGSNDEQYMKKTGNKWWGRINRHYFLKINEDVVQNMRQFTTSQDIIQFGSQISPFLPYYQQIVYSTNPYIFQDDSIRILYRHFDKITQKQTHALAGYLIKNNINPQNKQQPIQQAWRMPNFYSFHAPLTNNPRISVQNQKQNNDIIANQCKNIDLILSGKTFNQEYIEKCLKYQTIWRKQNITQVQKQLECWKFQLEYQHRINQQMWDKIQDNIELQKIKYPQRKSLQMQIQLLKRNLIHSQTYSYFRSGYSDKTQDDFATAVAYAQQHLHLNLNINPNVNPNLQMKQMQNIQMNDQQKQPKKQALFETDCKICFCTKNQPSNKVIYCDKCNTSFHQSCYGIQKLDQRKQLICDACTYMRKYQQQYKVQCIPLTCQICARSKFPIKNINNHFYHVSCLILFGFADIHMFKINLKPGVNHTTITQAVIENQMDQYYCQFCMKNCYSGMKFKCSYPLCVKSFHPICAYLNGCIFQINRKVIGGINVKVQCRQHKNSDIQNLYSQVYLRRYLCNYRKTAQGTQEDFRKKFTQQLEKLNNNQNRVQFEQGGIKRILNLKNVKFQRKKSQSMKRTHSVQPHSPVLSNKSSLKQIKSKRTQSSKQKISKPL